MSKEHQPGSGSAAEAPQRPFWKTPLAAASLMIALIGVFYLLREHWDHVAGLWIYALLLACPLMHLFHGHGGHAEHGHRNPHGPGDKDRPA